MKNFTKASSRAFQNRVVWNLYIKNGHDEAFAYSVIPYNTYGY